MKYGLTHFSWYTSFSGGCMTSKILLEYTQPCPFFTFPFRPFRD